MYQWVNECSPTAFPKVVLGLTTFGLHLQMQLRKTTFRMTSSVSEAKSYLNRSRIDTHWESVVRIKPATVYLTVGLIIS